MAIVHGTFTNLLSDELAKELQEEYRTIVEAAAAQSVLSYTQKAYVFSTPVVFPFSYTPPLERVRNEWYDPFDHHHDLMDLPPILAGELGEEIARTVEEVEQPEPMKIEVPEEAPAHEEIPEEVPATVRARAA